MVTLKRGLLPLSTMFNEEKHSCSTSLVLVHMRRFSLTQRQLQTRQRFFAERTVRDGHCRNQPQPEH